MGMLLGLAIGVQGQQHLTTAALRLVPAADAKDSVRFSFLPKAQLNVPANFATSNYGFFCRQELKLDKKTVMPIRFRLGSMEECNRLEGK